MAETNSGGAVNRGATTAAAVTVAAPSWATSIPAGSTANVGFTGSSSAAATVPTAFTLNGVACGAG